MHGRPGATAGPASAKMGAGPKGPKPSTSKGVTMSSNAIGLAGGSEASSRPRAGAEAGLSIVVPVYNEAAGLVALHGRIVEVARRLRAAHGLMVEVVYVDDGS